MECVAFSYIHSVVHLPVFLKLVLVRWWSFQSGQGKWCREVYHANNFSTVRKVREARRKTSLSTPFLYTSREWQGFILFCIHLDWWRRKEKLMNGFEIPCWWHCFVLAGRWFTMACVVRLTNLFRVSQVVRIWVFERLDMLPVPGSVTSLRSQ